MTTSYGSPARAGREPSGWAVGWIAFAGTMMMIQGVWWCIAGLVALFNDEFYVLTPDYILQFDVTTWGWIHLLIGLLVLSAGVAVFSGAVWARTVGVFVAVIATIAAFAWLPWYPLWGILLIVISVSVIWALTAHGHDVDAFD
jgi:hypothetical protein